MVMENPQTNTAACVGVELVRQYYTMLNKAPLFLHRFYSNDSLMTHGTNSGRHEIIQGQSQIHQKVLSLGFTECHAKIKKIMCQMTIGDGVVVQVAGELSNDGAPLRQFMQTFVLVPQTVKKYYVHNDIFHYLDEVFKEDVNNVDEGVSSGGEEDLETQATTVVSEGFNIAPTLNGTPQTEVTVPILTPQPQSPMLSPIVTPATQTIPTKAPSPAPVAAPKVATPPPATPPTPQPAEPTPSPPAKWVKSQEPKAQAPTTSPTPAKAAAPAPTEPKTYANLFKNPSSRPFSMNTPARNVSPPPEKAAPVKAPAQAKTPPPPRSQTKSPLTNGSSSVGQGNRAKFFQQGNSRFNHNDDQEKRSLLPDSHQVFVGNLHQSVTEDVLKEKFSTFGKVTEMRINTAKGKTMAKGTGHTVPNFGFVGFETKEAVERCLQSRPIYLKGDRINVEEKKARSTRMPDDRPSSRGRGGLSRGGSRGGGRGFARNDSTREGGYAPRR